MSLTAELAQKIATSSPSPEAVEAARLALIDFLATAIAGETGSDSGRAKTAAFQWAGHGEAILIGSAQRVDAGTAALLNGYFGHALDYDDVHPSMRGHPGTVLFPALLASVTDEDAERLLGAFVVGVEVAGRLGLALGSRHYEKGFHNTATLGALAAAAAVAWLRKLRAEDIELALGLAATQAAGLRLQFGTEVKPLHAGLAARAGLQAVGFVEAGLSAATGVLDGSNGFFSLYGFGGQNPEQVAADWGAPWQILSPGLIFKEFACCTATHCAAQATLGLIAEHEIDIASIDTITVTFPLGGDAPLLVKRPATGVDGRFSVEYVVARALVDGRLSVAAFDETSVTADVLSLCERVYRAYDETAPRMSTDPATRFSVVEIQFTDGTVLSRRENRVNGISDPSDKLLDAGGTHALLDALRTMKTKDQLGHVLKLLTETRSYD